MEPIGPLMHEHRLIERMIEVLDQEATRLEQGNTPDLPLLFKAVEFIRVYADQCHHGKEEDILFRDLEGKELSSEHKYMLRELVEDHKHGRRLVGELEERAAAFAQGGDPSAVAETLRKLTSFYPEHIEKEDKHFFFPVLEYLSEQERQDQLNEFDELERGLLHERYGSMVSSLERQRDSD